MRSHPAQLGETFDGTPTLERSGSEHRVGRFSPSLLRKERLGEKGGAFFNGKEGRDDFRKLSLWLKILQMSAMKVCFQIAECS